MKHRVLVTGGAGYIGTHTCTALLDQGCEVTVVDNLSNGTAEALEQVKRLTQQNLTLIEADIRDRESMHRILREGDFDVVVHFAALKVLTESLSDPVKYYDHNVGGTAVLLEAMQAAGVRNLVFSSSAAVYGMPETVPIDENAPLLGSNPYARTKAIGESIIADQVRADPRWRAVCLRYFNPVGAHESGLIGESPLNVPTNLMPIVCEVALGKRPRLQIFGDQHPTPDGTCVRDFIHIMDLAEGHVRAVEWLMQNPGQNCLNVNLGTGNGHSVQQLVNAFEEASGRRIPCEIAPVRPGEVPSVFAQADLARDVLGWQAKRPLDAMCADAWRWASRARERARPRGPLCGFRLQIDHFHVQRAEQPHHLDRIARVVAMAQLVIGLLCVLFVMHLHDAPRSQMELAVRHLEFAKRRQMAELRSAASIDPLAEQALVITTDRAVVELFIGLIGQIPGQAALPVAMCLNGGGEIEATCRLVRFLDRTRDGRRRWGD
nr:UDP-glucose 4-epimerase GalE [Diaphorobacter aerolatus]